MAAMLIVMVVFLVVAGHHGVGERHDAAPPKAEAPHTPHMQASPPASPEGDKR